MATQIRHKDRPHLSPMAQAVGLALVVMANMATVQNALAGPGYVDAVPPSGAVLPGVRRAW